MQTHRDVTKNALNKTVFQQKRPRVVLFFLGTDVCIVAECSGVQGLQHQEGPHVDTVPHFPSKASPTVLLMADDAHAQSCQLCSAGSAVPTALREGCLGAGLAIWTTTPWTMPANAAVALNEKLQYTLVEAEASLHWSLCSVYNLVYLFCSVCGVQPVS